ncbi:MAG: carotenoid biosynthesis protein [Anaerolineales bacterium]|nr:carotenoid biosynthesis protein [Anaerolineales bacterium]
MFQRYWTSGVIFLWACYTLLMGYFILQPLFNLPFSPFLLSFTTLFCFFFSLGHAMWSLGGRQAGWFLLITFAISLLFESVGVLTGWVYGPYHYTDRLGYKIFGLVPFLIPIAWFMMIYPAYVLVKQLVGTEHKSLRALIWLSALSALAMTAWDVVMDPIMVAAKHWVWEVDGAFFGIPVHNYVGWLATTFTVYLLYALLERRLAPQPWGESTPFFRSLPFLVYAITWLGNVAVAKQINLTGPALAGFFAMGSFALLGLGKIFEKKMISDPQT